MTRVAAVDCGTNSVRLLVTDLPAGTDVVRQMEIVRLGRDVDRTGRLAPEAIERTRSVLAGYAEQIARLGVDHIRMVATSATRDAANAEEFRAMVGATLGVLPDVVTGEEEARLSFAGAVRRLPPAAGPPYLVVDIGGGSTEFVTGGAGATLGAAGGSTGGAGATLGAAGGISGGAVVTPGAAGGAAGGTAVDQAISVDIGCVRMTERYLHGDPPSQAETAAAEAEITDGVRRALRAVSGHGARTLIGLAGSVTTVAAIALGLDGYQAERIHHAWIRYDDVARVTADLLAMTNAQRLAIPVMHPGRADVIGAGALMLRVIMHQAGAATVLASEHDILDGIALSIADSAGAVPPVPKVV